MDILLYLIISFAIPWITLTFMNLQGLFGSVTYMLFSAIIMWMPASAAAIVHLRYKRPVISFSWKPAIRKNLKYYILSWFMPLILSLLGSLVYFIIFREKFSLVNLESTQMPLHVFLLMTLLAIIPASLLNMFFALGEETGWRGFLYPALSIKYGRTKASLITGIIWGVWHTPINMMGYNYGLGYYGYPFTGIAAMCLSCIVLGIWCSFLAEKTNSIWVPSLFHGSVNAAGTLGIIFLKPGTSYLSGPGITGIIPSIIAGVLLVPFVVYDRKGRIND